MATMTRILVTGATGFTGQAVVERALAQGLLVTAVTRDSRRMRAREGLTVIETDMNLSEDLRVLLEGHDAVVHCLGVGGKGDGRETRVVSEATTSLVAAMVAAKVRRLVVLSNVGAGSSADQGPWAYRRVVRPIVSALFLRWLTPIIEDKNRMEPMVMQSPLDWTIVRLPNVSGRRSRGRFRVSTGRAAVGLGITRDDLAQFLVAAISTPALVAVALSVSN